MIYMFLANGFEETEAIAPLDILRRAGVEIKTVGIGSKTVTGSHGIPVTADLEESGIDLTSPDFKGIVLPGGMPGTENLYASETVKKAALCAAQKGLLAGAICAAPTVYGRFGLLKDKKATCYPGCEDRLFAGEYTGSAVCRDGNFITAIGAGASVRFGLALAEYLCGKEVADKVENAIKCAP